MKHGETVGGYRIVRRIGVGGMGEVFEVEHLALGTLSQVMRNRRVGSSWELADISLRIPSLSLPIAARRNDSILIA